MARKDLIVSKSNALINANYKLSLDEQRLVLIALSKIDSRGSAQREFEVTGQEFARFTGLPDKYAYDALYKAAKKLFSRELRWKEYVEDEEIEVLLHLTSQIKLGRKGSGRVKLKWTEEVMPYISQLQSRFTSYKLQHALALSSTYSIRIFELIMQFKISKSRTIKLDDFKSMLKLENKYPKFKSLNEKVIQPSIKDINKNTPYIVSFSFSKTGRVVTELHFDFQEKDDSCVPEKEIKRMKKVVNDTIERCKHTVDMFE